MALNQLVDLFFSTGQIYFDRETAIYSKDIMEALMDHQKEALLKDFFDDEKNVFDRAAAEDAIILMVEETDAFKEWDANNGDMRDE